MREHITNIDDFKSNEIQDIIDYVLKHNYINLYLCSNVSIA